MSASTKIALQTEFRDGLMWPKADDAAFPHIKMYLPLIKLAARQCRQHRTAIQAGGNAGMYPVALAGFFDSVLTFEPESLNYECLVYNCRKFKHVKPMRAILGDSDESVGLEERAGLMDGELCVNSGAFRVSGEGDIPQVRIDDLGIDDLDFIQLDVEGYELKVLEGAKETIDRCSPVIMVERVDHGDDPEPFIESMGYVRIIKGLWDCLYVRKDGTNDIQ
jgi:FkbM family methyltransferase